MQGIFDVTQGYLGKRVEKLWLRKANLGAMSNIENEILESTSSK